MMLKIPAAMISYTPQSELNVATFEELFKHFLDRNNRWVKLADALPWDELASIYMQSLSADNGRPTIDVRLAVGALIIKHKLGLSDREVVSTIRENVYIQYFVGYRWL
ncbi:MAG: transposase [Ignavibacteria bacterium]|nr:transposase [Ignavibacteria bacterium]